MERKSNYEAVRESWRRRFLAMDCTALARRFHLKLDDDFLYLTYFSHPCAIDRRTARIARLDRPGAEIGFNMEMTFFNMFHYAHEEPAAFGRDGAVSQRQARLSVREAPTEARFSSRWRNCSQAARTPCRRHSNGSARKRSRAATRAVGSM